MSAELNTNEYDFEFLCQSGSVDLNVCNEDEEEADDDQDDLSAGYETGHSDTLEMSDDDRDAAVEYCGHN